MSSAAVTTWTTPAMKALARIRSSRTSRTAVARASSAKPSGPQPTDSVGRLIARIGSQTCWEAVGPARTTFQTLGREIKEYLDDHSEPLPDLVTWSIYMVGSNPQTAKPTIIFCCREEAHRKAVRNTIRESHLLEPYPGIALKHLPRAPDFNQLVQLASGIHGKDSVKREMPDNTPSVPLVFCNGQCVKPGTQLFIRPDEGSTMRKATVGGMVHIKSEQYLMTAAHVFADAPAWPAPEVLDTELFFSDDEEEDDDERLSMASYSSPSPSHCDSDGWEHVSSAASSQQNEDRSISASEMGNDAEQGDQSSGKRQSEIEPSLIPECPSVVGKLAFSSADGMHPELDYALIRLTEEARFTSDLGFPTLVMDTSTSAMVGQFTHNTHLQVIAFTASSGVIKGYVSSTPAFIRPPNATKYQEVYPAQFESALANGDCGSWVLDPFTSMLYGHVVAGSPGVGLAYIVPAAQVFRDIDQQLRSGPSLCFHTSEYETIDGTKNLRRSGLTVDLAFREPQPDGLVESTYVPKAPVVTPPPYSESVRPHSTSVNSNPLLQKHIEPAQEAEVELPARDLTQKFRKLLSENRLRLLVRSRVHCQQPDVIDQPSTRNALPPYIPIRNLPFEAAQPGNGISLRFRDMLLSLSNTPLRWENPGLLDEALQIVPLERLFQSAEDEYHMLQAEAESLGNDKKAAWGFQDCLARALTRWFKREFFSWVNNPPCPVCNDPTTGEGLADPLPDEFAGGARHVELYKCSNSNCSSFARFPRYADAFFLLQTRQGRVGEWANCFGMLCRALGCRVRWVWNAEDHVWVELYSEHRKRWVPVDVAEEAWDKPLLYTQGWGKKLSYCVAFSIDGAYDVTRRYVPSSRYALLRKRSTEPELLHILEEIRALRQEKLSKEDKYRLKGEEMKDEWIMRRFTAAGLATELSKLQVEDLGSGQMRLVEGSRGRRKADETARENVDADFVRHFVQ